MQTQKKMKKKKEQRTHNELRLKNNNENKATKKKYKTKTNTAITNKRGPNNEPTKYRKEKTSFSCNYYRRKIIAGTQEPFTMCVHDGSAMGVENRIWKKKRERKKLRKKGETIQNSNRLFIK